jgi:ribosomal protein S18 acetylase RimI-like enzyme
VEIRAFNGSLRDAQAIVDIDRATFADCPYDAQQIAALEADPSQYAWVAEEEGQVVGYVSAFATYGLEAGRWEIDELAVHPRAQRRGIATALVARSLEEAARESELREARALVSVRNPASQRVFLKNGFRDMDTVHLLACRGGGRPKGAPRSSAMSVRRAGPSDCPALARLLSLEEPKRDAVARMARQLRRPEIEYLVAVGASGQVAAKGAHEGHDGHTCTEVVAGAEVIHVRTLQYEGLWIEAMAVADCTPAQVEAASVLVSAAVERVERQAELDLVGYLVAPRQRVLYAAAVTQGLALVDIYKLFVYPW